MNLKTFRKRIYDRWTYRDWWRVLNTSLYFDAALEVEKARLQTRTTQKELAARVGTQQPAIARIERGNTNLSLRMMRRLANAMGYVVRVKLVPLKDAIAEEYNGLGLRPDAYSVSYNTNSSTVTFSIPQPEL